jgi:Ca2+/Na+ antiporter
MNAVVGCIAPEKWWADQRAKRRTVVLVIVLLFYVWLTVAGHLSATEAIGMVVMLGIAAGIVLDRVVDATPLRGTELAALIKLAMPVGPQ